MSILSEFYSGSKSYLPHLDSGEICGNSVGDLGSSVSVLGSSVINFSVGDLGNSVRDPDCSVSVLGMQCEQPRQ